MKQWPPPVMLSDEEPLAHGQAAISEADILPPPVSPSDEEPMATGGR